MGERSSSGATGSGIGWLGLSGTILAAFSSLLLGNPIGWVVVHGAFSWFYVVWLCMGFGGGWPYPDEWTTPARDLLVEECDDEVVNP